VLTALFPRAHARYASLPLLGGVWDGLCIWLRRRGYPASAIRRRIQAGRLLEEWLCERGVRSLRQCTAAELRALAPAPVRWTDHLACALVRSLTDYLEERGELSPSSTTPTDERVAEYRRYLEGVRGLALSTLVREGRRVSDFLRFLEHDARPERLAELKAADVDAFIALAGRRLGRASMQKLTATLRSFLKYLEAGGKTPLGLRAQIDSPRCFRGERLPRSIPWESVRLLLRSVDRSSAKGLRDYAMLLLIATYGLRVSEVAALTLDHVLWRSRQIRVPRPKVGTPLLLPLTDEVATALLDYLRLGRTPSQYRHLFLRVRVPAGPIKATAVSDAFDVWVKRCGIQLVWGAAGPHCLRHSLAVHLLREGTPVKTIGDLLGHRSAESTCVYLRLQIEDLRDVALSLPQAVVLEVRK